MNFSLVVNGFFHDTLSDLVSESSEQRGRIQKRNSHSLLPNNTSFQVYLTKSVLSQWIIHIFSFHVFFLFFYSTLDFRIHICLKIFTYEQHGEHQGLFNFKKNWTFYFFYSVGWTCASMWSYTIKDALNSKHKFQICYRNDTMSPSWTDPWCPKN